MKQAGVVTEVAREIAEMARGYTPVDETVVAKIAAIISRHLLGGSAVEEDQGSSSLAQYTAWLASRPDIERIVNRHPYCSKAWGFEIWSSARASLAQSVLTGSDLYRAGIEAAAKQADLWAVALEENQQAPSLVASVRMLASNIRALLSDGYQGFRREQTRLKKNCFDEEKNP